MPLTVGCQFCKDLLSWGLAQGFAWTIGLLLIVPFLCVAVITLLIVHAAKRAPQGQRSRMAKTSMWPVCGKKS